MNCPEGNTTSKTWDDYVATGEDRSCYCTDSFLKMSTTEQAQVLWDVGILSSLVYYDSSTGKAISSLASKFGPYSSGKISGYTKTQTTAIFNEIIGALCDIGQLGDMFQATSTNDVTFWVLHPTMERMWHLIQLNIQQNLVVFDESWDDSAVNTQCPGHRSYSVTPFKNLWDNDNKLYTNSDLYRLLHPDNNNYVYENFNWPHCEFLKFSMTGY